MPSSQDQISNKSLHLRLHPQRRTFPYVGSLLQPACRRDEGPRHLHAQKPARARASDRCIRDAMSRHRPEPHQGAKAHYRTSASTVRAWVKTLHPWRVLHAASDQVLSIPFLRTLRAFGNRFKRVIVRSADARSPFLEESGEPQNLCLATVKKTDGRGD